MPKLALRAQTVGIAFLSFRQDLSAKNVSMSTQKDFRLGNTRLDRDRFKTSKRVISESFAEKRLAKRNAKFVQAISKIQIAFKYKARADEKAQHKSEYVSILKRIATP